MCRGNGSPSSSRATLLLHGLRERPLIPTASTPNREPMQRGRGHLVKPDRRSGSHPAPIHRKRGSAEAEAQKGGVAAATTGPSSPPIGNKRRFDLRGLSPSVPSRCPDVHTLIGSGGVAPRSLKALGDGRDDLLLTPPEDEGLPRGSPS